MHTETHMKTGRPTFQIDPRRLRDLRQDAGLTQQEVARRAYRLLDKPAPTTLRTMVSHYQRLEKTGRTSKSMADALAIVLNTSIPELQGQSPDEVPDSVARIEQQLRDQLATKTNLALHAALKRDQDAEDPIRTLAVGIAGWVEAAQIGQQAAELARLAELTGWTEEQLLRPVSLHGHWLLHSSVHGGRSTEIVLGASEVLRRIQEDVDKWAKYNESDTSIALREELPWMHVDITHARIPAFHCTFSFVRCRPKPSGLEWIHPTWRDRFWLDDPLMSWAFGRANFVASSNGQVRPRDVRRLRFLIEEYDTPDSLRPLTLVNGDLDELPQEVLRSFQADGSSHFVVTNWLACGLWPALLPHLDAWPLKCWKVRTGAYTELNLDVPLALMRARGEYPRLGAKYRIRLVEEVGQEKYEPAPWRQDSVATIGEALQRRLDEAVADVAVDPQPATPAPAPLPAT